jgi:pilus assembly protein CpaE
MLCARVSAVLAKRQLSTMAAKMESSESASNAEQRVVAFLGAKGGVGTTTVAANCASVAALSGNAAILCELRSNFGSLSLQLNARPREHVGTLLRPQECTQGADPDDYLVRDSSGLRILFGPPMDELDIGLTGPQAKIVIDALRPHAKLIFLDLAAGLNDLNNEIVKMCDRVVLVLDCEMTSIGAAKGIIDQLQQTSIRHSIKAVVVKRTPLSVPPRIDQVQSILGCDLIGTIPPGADALALAVKTGSTLATLQPEDLISATIRRLTEHMFVENSSIAAAP